MKTGRMILTAVICICLFCGCAFSAFAENEDGADGTVETTASQSLFGGVRDVLDSVGLGGTVDGILGGLENGDIQGAFSDAVGNISGGLTDTIDGYSSLLEGVMGGNQSQNGSQQNDVVNNGNNIQSNFAVPKSQTGGSYQMPVTQAQQTTAYTPAATTAPAAPQTNPVPQTTGQAQQSNDIASVVIDTSAQNTVWLFIAGIAAVIVIIILILVVVTKHTEFNSRVYDRTALKSVRKNSSSDMLIEDGDSPMDNIMYVGNSGGEEN